MSSSVSCLNTIQGLRREPLFGFLGSEIFHLKQITIISRSIVDVVLKKTVVGDSCVMI